MKFYAPFCLPFLVGALVMAAVIAWKYVVWFAELPRADKKRVLFGIPTPRTLGAVGEVIGECLLHRRIFRVNPHIEQVLEYLRTIPALLLLAD